MRPVLRSLAPFLLAVGLSSAAQAGGPPRFALPAQPAETPWPTLGWARGESMEQRPVADSGLARRMQREARRISSQHRQLDEHCALVKSALARGEPHSVRRAFARFADALEAHLSLEDAVYFPALHGLAREAEADLIGLAEQHGKLRAGVRRVSDRLAGPNPAAWATALDGFIAELAGHERREEEVLARTTGRPTAG